MNGPDVAVDERRDQLLAEIEELYEGRLQARRDARSGDPAKRAQGERAIEGIAELIRARYRTLKPLMEEDES